MNINFYLIVLNLIALIITIVWAINTKGLEPIAGIFILIAILIGLILKSIKPNLKLYYIIQKSGDSKLAGGPWRKEFKITIGLENKSKYKSAMNVNLNVFSENINFEFLETGSLVINPKDKMDILRSKRLIIFKNSQSYNDIIFDYEVSASDTRTVRKSTYISGDEIINKILKT